MDLDIELKILDKRLGKDFPLPEAVILTFSR